MVGKKERHLGKCKAAKKNSGSKSSGTIGAPFVRNDWDDDLALLSTEDLGREIERLKRANEELRSKLKEVSKSQAGWELCWHNC